jgi:hypothetical protein
MHPSQDATHASNCSLSEVCDRRPAADGIFRDIDEVWGRRSFAFSNP